MRRGYSATTGATAARSGREGAMGSGGEARIGADRNLAAVGAGDPGCLRRLGARSGDVIGRYNGRRARAVRTRGW